jgi:sugar (pentulose or hexulose) kinase
MCWLWVCCLVLWRGLYRESPVVLSAVSVSAAGFVEGSVLLSSYRAVAKGELFCPRGRWAVGIVAGLEVFIFVFFVWCDEFGRSR